ncbi:malate:quinone oxidoreductase [Prochlorococcus sp. MIT 1307]|uniref:malate:quinone oxidoreductase n=1 Tax=Prochlorococcus sp. MIT 1307 TaxID=3096219 RepID=UPI002A7615C2|nr:malate:quinone oxidoreductase [Prochlorococcus sp. MIT 1307]
MYVPDINRSELRYEAVLIGGGIMSSTLAVLLHELEPEARLLIVERLDAPALESSAAVNNAGTGHAANCELNYTPLQGDGTVNILKALEINKAFEQSLEFWASLTEKGKINPQKFLNVLPQISIVWGEPDVSYLRKRYQELNALPAFADMEWSTDFGELAEWMPLVMEGRAFGQQIAATRTLRGTDIDFGSLTKAYLQSLEKTGALELKLSTEVIDLQRDDKRSWKIELKDEYGISEVYSPFVFLGAGGGSLTLLQKSEIPEASQYAGFPVSGQWLVCSDSELTEKHNAKVYGKAKVGAPPMSVPHLDSRWIDGERSLLFGPFAGFTTKFLKEGSGMDLFRSINKANFAPMMQVGMNNFDLVKYLFAQLRLDDDERMKSLKEFLPRANQKDWTLSVAGQRVQIIKRTNQGGVLQMGTEVVTSADGSLAALLGASPGASTAVTIMLEVLQRCWADKMSSDGWIKRLRALLPSFGKDFNDEVLLIETRKRSNSLLNLM